MLFKKFCGEISTSRYEWSLVDTKLRAKVSFGGVLDSSSDLGEVKESLSDTVNKT